MPSTYQRPHQRRDGQALHEPPARAGQREDHRDQIAADQEQEDTRRHARGLEHTRARRRPRHRHPHDQADHGRPDPATGEFGGFTQPATRRVGPPDQHGGHGPHHEQKRDGAEGRGLHHGGNRRHRVVLVEGEVEGIRKHITCYLKL